MTTSTAEILKEFVDNNVDTVLFPVKTKDRINIGSYSIKPSKGMYSIKSYKTNEVVAQTYTKAAALAIAKLLNKKQSVDNILRLDDVAAKHKTDCIFYRYTINTTDSELKRDITQCRYDIARACERTVLEEIKQFIL
jgi:hypothetical protein